MERVPYKIRITKTIILLWYVIVLYNNKLDLHHDTLYSAFTIIHREPRNAVRENWIREEHLARFPRSAQTAGKPGSNFKNILKNYWISSWKFRRN